MLRIGHTCVLLSLALVTAGCSGGYLQFTSPFAQPGVRAQASPQFVPERMEAVAVIVEDDRLTVYPQYATWRQVEDEFIRALMARGYILPSRSDVRHILVEGEFQRESALTADDAAEIGRVLNVPAVMIVSLTEATANTERRTVTVRTAAGGERRERRAFHYGTATMSARLIDVETSAVLWIASATDRQSIPERARLDHVIRRVAIAIAESFPARYEQFETERETTG